MHRLCGLGRRSRRHRTSREKKPRSPDKTVAPRVRLSRKRAAEAGRLLARILRTNFRRAFIAALLAGAAVWAAQRTLPVDPPPRRAAPVVLAGPPARASHTPKSGYVMDVVLSLTECKNPVQVQVTAVVPKEFEDAEAKVVADPVRRVLWTFVTTDQTVHVTSMRAGATITPTQGPNWLWSLPMAAPSLSRAPAMLVGVVRDDAWAAGHSLFMTFKANWVHHRSQGTCWLAVPELASRQHTFLGIFAGISAAVLHGSRTGADPLFEGDFSWGGWPGTVGRSTKTRPVNGPNGIVQVPVSANWTNEYADARTPLGAGTVRMYTPLSVIAGDTRRQPIPGETPEWACHDVASSGPFAAGGSESNQFSFSPSAPLSNYAVNDDLGCGGYVALSEPGAAAKRDAWLIIIGALASLSATLLVDIALHARLRLQD